MAHQSYKQNPSGRIALKLGLRRQSLIPRSLRTAAVRLVMAQQVVWSMEITLKVESPLEHILQFGMEFNAMAVR